jgi:hypothetical protein
METNVINYYRIKVESFKPTEISVKKIGPSTFLCRLNSLNFINEFNAFGFIVEIQQYNDPAFINHGNIPIAFLKKVWEQIFSRIDTPDYDERI